MDMATVLVLVSVAFFVLAICVGVGLVKVTNEWAQVVATWVLLGVGICFFGSVLMIGG